MQTKTDNITKTQAATMADKANKAYGGLTKAFRAFGLELAKDASPNHSKRVAALNAWFSEFRPLLDKGFSKNLGAYMAHTVSAYNAALVKQYGETVKVIHFYQTKGDDGKALPAAFQEEPKPAAPPKGVTAKGTEPVKAEEKTVETPATIGTEKSPVDWIAEWLDSGKLTIAELETLVTARVAAIAKSAANG